MSEYRALTLISRRDRFTVTRRDRCERNSMFRSCSQQCIHLESKARPLIVYLFAWRDQQECDFPHGLKSIQPGGQARLPASEGIYPEMVLARVKHDVFTVITSHRSRPPARPTILGAARALLFLPFPCRTRIRSQRSYSRGLSLVFSSSLHRKLVNDTGAILVGNA